MRIWLAASIAPSSYGGVHRSINKLADTLRVCGHTVDIIYARPQREHHVFRFSLRIARQLLLTFWRRPDWIIARSTDGVASLLLIGIFKLKTRIALHSHGWEERVYEVERRLPSSLITNPTTWRGRIFRFALLRFTLKHATLCICGTIDESRWLQSRRKTTLSARGKIAVIPNGVSVEKRPFWPEQEVLPPSFLIVGGFTWKKNIEYGIELFRRFLEHEEAARLFIVGCGTLTKEKKSLLYTLGDAVFTVESETPEKMARWYETCPMLLSPSRYEGGRSLAIIEAQNRGGVVFASDIPASRECITDGINGVLLSCVNPVRDVQLLESYYRNQLLMKTIGMAAWKKASRNSWQRQGSRCESILQRRIKK